MDIAIPAAHRPTRADHAIHSGDRKRSHGWQDRASRWSQSHSRMVLAVAGVDVARLRPTKRDRVGCSWRASASQSATCCRGLHGRALAGDVRATRSSLSQNREGEQGRRPDRTRQFALATTFLSTCAIAVGYAAAFSRGGTPGWAPWLLALGIPAAIGGIMMLGAARGRAGIGKLKIPFAFVV